MLEISLTKGANYQHLSASAYIGLCLCLCASGNQPINFSSFFERTSHSLIWLLQVCKLHLQHSSSIGPLGALEVKPDMLQPTAPIRFFSSLRCILWSRRNCGIYFSTNSVNYLLCIQIYSAHKEMKLITRPKRLPRSREPPIVYLQAASYCLPTNRY